MISAVAPASQISCSLMFRSTTRRNRLLENPVRCETWSPLRSAVCQHRFLLCLRFGCLHPGGINHNRLTPTSTAETVLRKLWMNQLDWPRIRVSTSAAMDWASWSDAARSRATSARAAVARSTNLRCTGSGGSGMRSSVLLTFAWPMI